MKSDDTPSVRAAKRLRVLQVVQSLGYGGAEQLQVIQARYHDAARYDLRICCLDPLGDSPIVRELLDLAVPIYNLGGARLHDPRPLLHLVRLIRRHRIDVLHTHLSTATVFGALAGSITARPVVSTLHNLQDLPEHSRVTYYLSAAALRWRVRVVIAVAPEVADDAHSHLRLSRRKLVVVPNGIDTAAFAHLDPAMVRARREELTGGRSGPLVVSVGNVRIAKGHLYLVEATPRLLAAFPDAQVAIIGPRDDCEAEVRERISALGLEGRILRFEGRRDIPEILAAADLFVLPSLTEGLPLALLEAMASGTPVLATTVGGIPRVVTNGQTGRLVPPANAGALTQAMLEVLDQPAVARRMAEAARVHVLATYAGEVWARRLQDVYSAVASTGVPRGEPM